mgnify:CR=1 FL=1
MSVNTNNFHTACCCYKCMNVPLFSTQVWYGIIPPTNVSNIQVNYTSNVNWLLPKSTGKAEVEE